jgi:hypothetical protein
MLKCGLTTLEEDYLFSRDLNFTKFIPQIADAGDLVHTEIDTRNDCKYHETLVSR